LTNLARQAAGVTESKIMNNTQLEFGLVAHAPSLAAPAPRRRQSRATWWFSQMRQVVDTAIDWSTEVAPRPGQIVLPGTHREIQLSSR